MQVTQAGDKNSQHLRVKEEIFKFRTPLNFKNMKKIWINRSSTETTTQTKHASPTPAPDIEKLDRKEIIKPVVPLSAVKEVQPPLPPYPPPPNSPPKLNVVIKLEKEDVDFGNPGEVVAEPVTKPVPEKLEEPNISRPKPTICKEFIRGNCTRPVCKYAHEIDVSQLPGVFTFCWDYQNAKCKYPNCKYVHATFFEESEFYRTGVLPPHVRAQLQKQKQAASRPPHEELLREIRPNFSNPPPSIYPGADKAMPVISCVPTSYIEQRPEDFRAPLPRSTSPFKREWGQIHEFSRSPRDRDLDCEHLAKKCKNCKLMEFSLKTHEEFLKTLIESSEEKDREIGQLNKKSEKLFYVIATLLKPQSGGKTTLSNGLLNGADKEKSMLEHLPNLVAANNRLSSAINDDNIKNILGGSNVNMSSLMAKILYSPGEQVLPQDSSRDT